MEKKKKVLFATPSLEGPTAPYMDALAKSIPLIIEAGWDEAYVQEVGCPYISHARSKMTRRALDAGADVIVYLDYDLSWDPEDLLTLINTEGDVAAGTYRYKKDEVEYMGALECNFNGTPKVNKDGTIEGFNAPAGFLKITRNGVRRFMKAYPQLIYGDQELPSIDLFNHGAIDGVWYGEDMAFSKRWKALGGQLKIVPNLNLNHHAKNGKVYPGNFHEFMLNQPRPSLLS